MPVSSLLLLPPSLSLLCSLFLPLICSIPPSPPPTLNDGEQDNDDEEEEGDIKEYPVNLVLVSVWRLDLVTNTASRPHSLVQVEHEALEGEMLNYNMKLFRITFLDKVCKQKKTYINNNNNTEVVSLLLSRKYNLLNSI